MPFFEGAQNIVIHGGEFSTTHGGVTLRHDLRDVISERRDRGTSSSKRKRAGRNRRREPPSASLEASSNADFAYDQRKSHIQKASRSSEQGLSEWDRVYGDSESVSYTTREENVDERESQDESDRFAWARKPYPNSLTSTSSSPSTITPSRPPPRSVSTVLAASPLSTRGLFKEKRDGSYTSDEDSGDYPRRPNTPTVPKWRQPTVRLSQVPEANHLERPVSSSEPTTGSSAPRFEALVIAEKPRLSIATRPFPTDNHKNPIAEEERIRNPGDEKRITALLSRLRDALDDKKECRHLLSFAKGPRWTQRILDLFQTLLDMRDLDPPFRRLLIVTMKRLSTETNMYPRRFILSDIEMISESILDRGGFADIRQGHFQGERVCLKILRASLKDDVENLIKTFAREAILWGQLSHPNISPFYGVYEFGSPSQMAFISPWHENGNIYAFLKGNPTVNRILLCCDAAVGVEYLHEHGIIHGDLKGGNVLIDHLGRARVADFGISAVSDPKIAHWTSQSEAMSKGGTTRWQAPELNAPGKEGEENQDIPNTKESDVYAFACTCYEILTEKLPFFEFTRDATVLAKVQDGKRPSSPLTWAPPCTERGEADKIWGLLEDCWKHSAFERPVISDVITRLELEKPPDSRPIGGAEIPAMRFRNATNASIGDVSIDVLESILAGTSLTSPSSQAIESEEGGGSGSSRSTPEYVGM